MFCFVDGIYVYVYEIERDPIDSLDSNDVLISRRLRLLRRGRSKVGNSPASSTMHVPFLIINPIPGYWECSERSIIARSLSPERRISLPHG